MHASHPQGSRSSSLHHSHNGSGDEEDSDSESDSMTNRPTGMSEEEKKEMEALANRIKALEVSVPQIAPLVGKRINDTKNNLAESLVRMEAKLRTMHVRCNEELS